MGHGECSDSLGKGSDTSLVEESGNNKNCPLIRQSYEPARYKVGLLGDLLGKELRSSRSVLFS
jgi:hypothetical protein